MVKTLPLGVSEFPVLRRNPGYLYIDKTRYLAALFPPHGLEHAHLFLARPRRFGKTLWVSTVEALFQGRKELFANTWIGREGNWDWDRNRLAVLRLSLALRGRHSAQTVEQALGRTVGRQARAHKVSCNPALPADEQLEDLVRLLAEKSEDQIVVLIDEYDMAITENLGHTETLPGIVDVMRGFYGVLKELGGCIRHTFVTGITRFSRTGLFSGANHLKDLSFFPEVNALLGFTQAEMRGNPDMDTLVGLCAGHLQCSADELYGAMARRYNGYRFARGGEPVCNPYSVAGCLFHLGTPDSAALWSLDRLPDFWAESGTPSVLLHILRANPQKVPLEDAADSLANIEETHFDVEDPPLAGLLYQSGYLTRKPAPKVLTDTDEEILDFPNREVRNAFENSLRAWYKTQTRAWFARHEPDPQAFLARLRKSLVRGDEKAFRNCLAAYLSSLPYVLHRLPSAVAALAHYEVYYQSLLYMLFIAMGAKPQAEMPTVTGRLDLVMEIADRIIVLELKIRQNATQALKQAFVQDYATPFQTWGLPVVLYGLQFDKNLLVIQDFRQWTLGVYDAAAARWTREPFPVPLSELANLSLAERRAYAKTTELHEVDTAWPTP